METRAEGAENQFRSGMFGFDEMQGFISGPSGSGNSSFTALLGLPPPQAVELLVKDDFTAPPPIFPSDVALVDRASKFSVFATGEGVKQEPVESENSEPAVSDQSERSNKRKEREKKVKETNNKKSKKVLAKEGENGEKLPYVHVRARRGQATDSHSLAERARREKINARMKLLQELVPGCNKISGTAMVLDEIINHVQALQRQVEFLSMRLAAVNPRIDFNLDALLAAENGSSMDNAYPGTFAPPIWPEGQMHGIKQQQFQQPLWNTDVLQQPVWGRGDDTPNFITPETSLLSYDSSGNSASLHTSQLKMEL